MSPIWQSFQELSLLLFLTIAISSTGLWLVTGMAVLSCRRTSAATRHRLLALSMVAVLIAPFLISILPIPRWITWGRPEMQVVPVIRENQLEPDNATAAPKPSTKISEEMGLMGNMGTMPPIGPINPNSPIEAANQQNDVAASSSTLSEQVPIIVTAVADPTADNAAASPSGLRRLPSLARILAFVAWGWMFGMVASAVLFVSSLW